jgi:hypothetical protein
MPSEDHKKEVDAILARWRAEDAQRSACNEAVLRSENISGEIDANVIRGTRQAAEEIDRVAEARIEKARHPINFLYRSRFLKAIQGWVPRAYVELREAIYGVSDGAESDSRNIIESFETTTRARLDDEIRSINRRWDTEAAQRRDTRRWVRSRALQYVRGVSKSEKHPEDLTTVGAADFIWRHTRSGCEVVFQEERGFFQNTKGMLAIGYLLSLPSGIPTGGVSDVRSIMDADDPQAEVLRLAKDTGQPMADAQAVSQIRERLRDICDELEAEDLGLSVAYREGLEDQRDKIERYLAHSVGLGGRARTLGGKRSVGQSVGAAIKRALLQIGKACPRLCRHLEAAIKDRYTAEVSYQPPEPLNWDVEM